MLTWCTGFLKGVIVRRLVACVGVVAMAVVMAVVPASAASANAPAPVSAFPYLPSQFVAGTSSAPPTLPPNATQAEWEEWRQRDRAYRQTVIDGIKGRNHTPQTAPQPVSPPKQPTRGIGGGPLGLAFLAPLLVDGGLQIIGVSKEGQALGLDGTALDQLVCTGLPVEENTFLAWLYSNPDCAMTYTEPNPDATASYTASIPGFTVTRLGVVQRPNNIPITYYTCFATSGTFPPTGWQAQEGLPGADPLGTVGWTNDAGIHSPNTTSLTHCRNTAGWVDTTGVFTDTDTVPPNPNFPSGPRQVRFRNTTTGEYVTAVESSPDPQRTPDCSVGWSDGSVTTATGEPYTEVGGLPLSSSALGCEEAYAQRPSPGVMPEWVKIESEQDGGARTEIADMPIPSEATQPKPSEGLRLLKVVGTLEKSCMTWEADCAEWWAESGQGSSSSSPYRCRFGDTDVALSECGIYRYTFREQTDTPTITDPGAEPGAAPGPTNQYNWGTGQNPYTPQNPATGPTPTGGGACSPSWSWNPVDWVLNPLKCAFIPSSESVRNALNRMTDAWDDTPPAVMARTVLPAFVIPEGDSSCQGPHIYMDFSGWWDGWPVIDWYPINACQAPMSHVATFARTVGSAILIYFTALGIVRRISAIVQAPGLGGGA